MKLKKSHFWYNKNQRNGIFYLLVLIISIQAFYFLFVNYKNEETKIPYTSEQLLLINEIDSLQKIAEAELEKKKNTFKPFNPNFISEYKGYLLGMSVEEIKRLHEFRETNKYVNSALEFQKVTKVHDTLLASIQQYFKFPEWTQKKKKDKKESNYKNYSNYSKSNNLPLKNNSVTIKGINSITKEELQRINGIGEKLAERILTYKNKLQGYTFNDQLHEVWGLKPNVVSNLLEYYRVLEKPTISKVDVNSATFKEILKLPYIDYELTKLIVKYRESVLRVNTIEEFKKIDGFPIEKFDRIALYLDAQ
ncbi:ComEA family DNA-binding protein [Aureivirga marina]|uniref:ComEA family DNA-binding protein n=1 Tax=Aureivirga marina TaxID=1182451 RepID=UPI0018CB63DA|nr:helix-hairpin-helix domain-containing protein [Aureivirga marina]